ncbi:3,4-dihydroxy-2-butanone-4-phosphate synthase [Pseudonocardia phyllosphaerae]|uniref:3,4-dihydroxy-2-butanone-4-phosphate synthase n=1 Tax=Pseudonocardia phyllosphaerae TaxID=3390502 RepID=UPI00397A7B80
MSVALESRASRIDGRDPVEAALASLRAGRPVLVADDDDREGEGDVVLPAASASPEWTAWTVRHTSGLLCVPMEASRADELDLPLMVQHNADPLGTAYTVSVDAATGIGTGISARDRARTARVLADPASVARDLTRPGHVLPLRARPGGVVERAGHTEAAVDLCRLAGLPPVGVIAEVVTGPEIAGGGRTANRREIAELGARHEVPVLDVADVVRYRYRHGDGLRARVTRGPRVTLPTTHGTFDAVGFRDEVTGAEHLALCVDPPATGLPVLAVHVECTAGDVFGGLGCGCRSGLDEALAAVADRGGAVLYLRGPATGGGAAGDAGAAASMIAGLGLSMSVLRPGPVSAAELRACGTDVVG